MSLSTSGAETATDLLATVASAIVGQTTPTPGVGPDELVDFWPGLVRIAWFVAGFLAILVVGWFVVEPLVSRAIRHRNRNNPTLNEAITRYVRLLVIVLAFVIALGTAGYGNVVADSALIVAAATLVVGVAAQTVIGSLVSGLVLVFDPEFNVGNYIVWDDGEGTVQSITLRVTRVLTPGGELVTIPNTTLTGGAITRPFGQERYRLVEELEVDYEADFDAALEAARAAAAELDAIAEAPTPRAHLAELAEDAVVIHVHYWLERPRPQQVPTVRSDYIETVTSRLGDADVAISPAPQRELSGRIDVTDFPGDEEATE